MILYFEIFFPWYVSCGAHEIMSEQYPWYAGPWPINPLAKVNIVFFCDIVAEQVFHPGPPASWETEN